MSNNKIQATTFWDFLNNYIVEIPIIQRDYAQGRIGKEKLREEFLAALKKALDDKKKLKLDFVYGSLEQEKFNPLDGQQRLTTLWLLHWYIAYKANKLEEAKKRLKKFTYETRVSSREFCQRLLELPYTENTNVVEHIKQQTWFYSEWKQDPTIQAMLNMLEDLSKKREDTNDPKKFKGFETDKYEIYWDLLISEECPIQFYELELNNFGLSDDLYIKMNARGKELTPFENFKADLVGWMKNKENPAYDYFNKKVKFGDKEIPYYLVISTKIDTIWTDIFWEYRSDDYKIDDIYFAFVKRFLLNTFILNNKDLKQNDLSENATFKFLYNGNDFSNIQHNSFDPYQSDLKVNIKSLEKVLDNISSFVENKDKNEINKFFVPNWEQDNETHESYLIPKYTDKREGEKKEYFAKSHTISQSVILFAICSYFEKNTYEEIFFNQWMRVVWNLVENSTIENAERMIGAIRLINELSEHSHDIYNFLANENNVVSSDFAKEQVQEEKEKAIQILKGIENGENWEEKIIEAETTAFFKGVIRFLFRIGIDENGDYQVDWSKFDDRFEKAKEYFDKNGVKERYKIDYVLLRFLISNFSRYAHFDYVIYGNNKDCWTTILTNTDLLLPLNLFLAEEVSNINVTNLNKFQSQISDDERLKYFQNDLCQTTILRHINSNSYLHRNWDKYSLFPYRGKTPIILADDRNKIFAELFDNKIIEAYQKLDNLPFFWGKEIYFKLCKNQKEYQFWDILKEKDENGAWIDIKENDKSIDINNLKDYIENL